MNLKEQLAAVQKELLAIQAKAKSEDREFTDEELATIEAKSAEAVSLKERIDRIAKGEAAFAAAAGDIEEHEPAGKVSQAKSLGEHAVKHLEEAIKKGRGQRFSISAPEYKAASDVHVTGGPNGVFGDVLTTVDTNIVTGARPVPVVADLLGQGTLSGTTIKYFVEGAREGNFTSVGENGQKPQIHYGNPTPVTESLTKIAGFIKESDELLDDLPFWVSAINDRLLYDLSVQEEWQLLQGAGAGNDLVGLLNRSIGTEVSADVEENADALFRAMTKVQVNSGLIPDGIVIHPTDYQEIRLQKDVNGQYYGGGFFAGAYGQGSLAWQPPLWGLRTVVTAAIPVGTALVGAFRQAATLYRKGGVSVDFANQNEDDFEFNRITVRAEERIALAVRRPSGFVKVTLGADS